VALEKKRKKRYIDFSGSVSKTRYIWGFAISGGLVMSIYLKPITEIDMQGYTRLFVCFPKVGFIYM